MEGTTEKRRIEGLERQVVRYYDEKTGLWYYIYWDDTLKCYVSQLESGQHPVLSLRE